MFYRLQIAFTSIVIIAVTTTQASTITLHPHPVAAAAAAARCCCETGDVRWRRFSLDNQLTHTVHIIAHPPLRSRPHAITFVLPVQQQLACIRLQQHSSRVQLNSLIQTKSE